MAVEKYVGKEYIQHNPDVAGGIEDRRQRTEDRNIDRFADRYLTSYICILSSALY